jgi:hypothetical protein
VHPYHSLPSESFWRTGVREAAWEDMAGLYRKKFSISLEDKIATAGSCFAQHIARYVRARDYTVMNVEPTPLVLSPERAAAYGYGLYSARYGNVYTVRHLLQMAQDAFDGKDDGFVVWEKDGRFYDALRPTVEPNGLDDAEEVRLHRAQHLQRVRKMLLEMDVFIFTLGLTETWADKDSGTVFPVAPGVAAGVYDPARHVFRNFSCSEVAADFEAFRARVLQERGRPARFLLTVSPVPLAATATGGHVLPATVYSKSVLRAAAGELQQRFDDVDYFPSYELVCSPWAGRPAFADNGRDVRPETVQMVMDYFSRAHGIVLPASSRKVEDVFPAEDDVHCDEAMLEALGA